MNMANKNIEVTFNLAGGRSGHRIKNISSAILFASMLKGNVVYNDTWIQERTSLIPEDAFLSKMEKVKHESFYDHVFPLTMRRVRGMSINEVRHYLKKVLSLAKKNKKVLLKLKGASRIHLHQAKLWEKQGKIEKGHADTCLEMLRYLQNFTHDPETITNTFAIHARRGDVAKNMISIGYNTDYYKKLITKINLACCDCGFCPEIKIYSEVRGSEDLDKLKSMENTKIIRGDLKNKNEHFDCMRRSEFLFLSWSSFCLWASFISTNNILVDVDTKIKHREGKIKDYNLKIPLFDKHCFFKLKELRKTIRGILEKK